MAVAKLTKGLVDKLPPGGLVWDTEIVGLGVRRQTTAQRHYVLRYPIPQRGKTKQRIMSIGRHGSALTVDQARTKAKKLLGLVADGRDPWAEREAERARGPGMTFGQAVERYIEHKRSKWKPGSLEQFKHLLKNLAEPLHRHTLSEVSRLQIAKLLDDLAANSGPTACNRTRTSLHSVFSWLTKRGLYEGTNPVAETERAEEKPSRDRVLTSEELAEVWAALGADRFSNIVRLLILTGQRRREIGNLRWSEIDFDRAMLMLPPERVKNGRAHEVPLSPQALAILRTLETAPTGKGHGRHNDGTVFGGFCGWSKSKERLDNAINDQRTKPMPRWTLHDLRRTVASGMQRLGVAVAVIEKVLNHSGGSFAGIVGIYQRHDYADEKRAALEKWAEHVEAITRLQADCS